MYRLLDCRRACARLKGDDAAIGIGLEVLGRVLLPGYKWLEVVPGRRGGRPSVRGTRITVDDILEMLAAGWRPEEVAGELGVPLEAVYEALSFASEALKRVVVVAGSPGG